MESEVIKAIEALLKKGDRVELIPVKDGVKIVHIKRKEIKPNEKIYVGADGALKNTGR